MNSFSTRGFSSEGLYIANIRHYSNHQKIVLVFFSRVHYVHGHLFKSIQYFYFEPCRNCLLYSDLFQNSISFTSKHPNPAFHLLSLVTEVKEKKVKMMVFNRSSANVVQEHAQLSMTISGRFLL